LQGRQEKEVKACPLECGRMLEKSAEDCWEENLYLWSSRPKEGGELIGHFRRAVVPIARTKNGGVRGKRGKKRSQDRCEKK